MKPRSHFLKFRQIYRFAIVALFCIAIVFPLAAQPSIQTLEQQGKTRYEAQQFPEAIQLWRQAITASQDRLKQAALLNNLSLAYQQLGQWAEAEQAIRAALAKLSDRDPMLAQVLDVQGRAQFAQGQTEAAIATWQKAATLYAQLKDKSGLARNQINQAQALQALGLFRQAEKTLIEANQTLQSEPDSLLKAAGLRSLGNVLRVTGNLQDAQRILQQSLAIATAIKFPPAIAETLLSLGNTARAQEIPSAIQFYQQAAEQANSESTQIKAKLNYLSLLIETKQFNPAKTLLTQIQAQIDRLPSSQANIDARINLAQSWMNLAAESRPSTARSIAQLLKGAIAQSRTFRSVRSESYALGALGELYEQNHQLSEAQSLTQQALLLSQAIHAPDITYQWQWQLGRLLKAQSQTESVKAQAIATYSDAINTLQSIRADLVAINPDIQFSFRERVEPVYREYVELLLQPSQALKQDNLKRARTAIEALQLAELENFFREACLQPSREIDQVVDQNQSAAAFYSIILPNRLEVILKLPQQEQLRHYSIAIAQSEVERLLDQLRQKLVQPEPALIEEAKTLSQTVYRWLIQPALNDLKQSNVSTLVFVLDGALRNIPIAALHDGQQYLIEQYSIALAPGLQLVNPTPLKQRSLTALAAGVSESRPPNFSELPSVPSELRSVQAEAKGEVLLNQQFTQQAFQSELNSKSFPVVHLATHGQFSSTLEKTFIVAWDQVIQVNTLTNLLHTREEKQPEAIELLVLSACQTASGDRRAALGIAGIAVRAGARSTIASLWSIGDDSTAMLMSQLYQALSDRRLPKAEALRQAQLFLLKHPNPTYQRPLAWAPYILIGNWL